MKYEIYTGICKYVYEVPAGGLFVLKDFPDKVYLKTDEPTTTTTMPAGLRGGKTPFNPNTGNIDTSVSVEISTGKLTTINSFNEIWLLGDKAPLRLEVMR